MPRPLIRIYFSPVSSDNHYYELPEYHFSLICVFVRQNGMLLYIVFCNLPFSISNDILWFIHVDTNKFGVFHF